MSRRGYIASAGRFTSLSFGAGGEHSYACPFTARCRSLAPTHNPAVKNRRYVREIFTELVTHSAHGGSGQSSPARSWLRSAVMHFSKGHDFAAWLGLVPKQISTGESVIPTVSDP